MITPPCQTCFKLTNCTEICNKMFPCKECLIVAVCKDFCKEIENKSYLLRNELINKNICPDCGTNNKFNVRQSFKKYECECQNCKHVFFMISFSYVVRGFK